jgi:hypothetical protein
MHLAFPHQYIFILRLLFYLLMKSISNILFLKNNISFFFSKYLHTISIKVMILNYSMIIDNHRIFHSIGMNMPAIFKQFSDNHCLSVSHIRHN